VSDSLREPRFVRLECAFFTPPLTAAAYSRLQCRRGEAHLKQAWSVIQNTYVTWLRLNEANLCCIRCGWACLRPPTHFRSISFPFYVQMKCTRVWLNQASGVLLRPPNQGWTIWQKDAALTKVFGNPEGYIYIYLVVTLKPWARKTTWSRLCARRPTVMQRLCSNTKPPSLPRRFTHLPTNNSTFQVFAN